MPCVTGPTKPEAEQALRQAIEAHCRNIAFPFGCRLAVQFLTATHGEEVAFVYEFVVLSPGEGVPRGRGWEIYENHGGRAVGRSA